MASNVQGMVQVQVCEFFGVRGAGSPPEFAGGSQSPTAVVVAGRTPRRAVTELREI